MSSSVFRIRASLLTIWPDCPRRAAARVFRPLIEEAGYQLRTTAYGIAAAIGTATHRAAQITLEERARSGTLPPASVATDAALDHLSQALHEGLMFDDLTPNRSDAVRQTVRMVGCYHREVAPGIEPMQIEQRLEAQVADDLVLSGQPDVVAIEPFQIDDLKTGVRARNHNAQIGAYSLLAKSAGIDIKQAAIDFIQRVNVAKPQPGAVRTIAPLAVAEATAFNTLRHIQQDLHTFRHGNPRFNMPAGEPSTFLANPASVMCSARWCSAHGTAFCTEWQVSEGD